MEDLTTNEIQPDTFEDFINMLSETIQRNFYPHVSMVINDLHSKGLLPEGEIGIKINDSTLPVYEIKRLE